MQQIGPPRELEESWARPGRRARHPAPAGAGLSPAFLPSIRQNAERVCSLVWASAEPQCGLYLPFLSSWSGTGMQKFSKIMFHSFNKYLLSASYVSLCQVRIQKCGQPRQGTWSQQAYFQLVELMKKGSSIKSSRSRDSASKQPYH